jgi:hypothetical protein
MRSQEGAEEPAGAFERLVSVVYQPREALGQGRTIHPSEMVFTYDDIAAKFGQYMSNWYSINENMRVVQNLYFSTLYESHMLIDNMFMQLIQALESFHRLKFDSRAMDEEEYKFKMKALLENVPDGEFKRLASEALAFGNHKPLKQRLIELADRYGRVLTRAYGTGRDDFLDKVKRTRNYRTHFDPKSKKDVLEGPELNHAYRLLRIVMEACFMVEMGMDAEEAQDKLSEKADYFV